MAHVVAAGYGAAGYGAARQAGTSYPFGFLRLYKKPYFAVFSFATRQKKCIFAIMNFTLY